MDYYKDAPKMRNIRDGLEQLEKFFIILNHQYFWD